MKKFLFAVIVIVSFFLPHEYVSAETSLQSQIDSVPAGGTLYLEDKLYSEPIVIKGPIKVVGKEGTTFQVCTNKPAITITGDSVELEGISIEKCYQKNGEAALEITGKNHQIKDIKLETEQSGIRVDHTEKSVFQNIEIKGANAGMGFDIWESSGNIFQDNKLSNVVDGFYLENSPNNSFFGNTVSKSRYGLHIMYSDQITAKKNVFKKNVTGAMVMETTGTVIDENWMGGNKQNVNAQGLLLYNVDHSVITRNTITDNRVGLYMENSSANQITANEINANFIGTQLNKIDQNVIKENSFVRNVNDIQAMKGTANEIKNNYWDEADKLDMNRDGKSDLVYHADPYFLNLTNDVPAFQLFFQNPGMILLQKMLKSPEEILVTDSSPLMENLLLSKQEVPDKQNQVLASIMSFVLISLSLGTILYGRKKL